MGLALTPCVSVPNWQHLSVEAMDISKKMLPWQNVQCPTSFIPYTWSFKIASPFHLINIKRGSAVTEWNFCQTNKKLKRMMFRWMVNTKEDSLAYSIQIACFMIRYRLKRTQWGSTPLVSLTFYSTSIPLTQTPYYRYHILWIAMSND